MLTTRDRRERAHRRPGLYLHAKLLRMADLNRRDPRENSPSPITTLHSAYLRQDITACVCLAVKTAGWQAEPEDEDFERDALCCFLTGVSRNGVYEFNVEGIEPPKHGIRNTMIENYFFDADVWVHGLLGGPAMC